MIYKEIYKGIERLIGDIQSFKDTVLKSPGFMDLHIERLSKDTIALTHYYQQNGDLIPDPDMEIRIYHKTKMAEALSYQDSFGFRRVYPEDNKIDIKAKKELNQFLLTWLRNLRLQGFKTEREN